MNHGQTCRLLIGMDSPRQFLGTIRLVQDIIGEGLTIKNWVRTVAKAVPRIILTFNSVKWELPDAIRVGAKE